MLSEARCVWLAACGYEPSVQRRRGPQDGCQHLRAAAYEQDKLGEVVPRHPEEPDKDVLGQDAPQEYRQHRDGAAQQSSRRGEGARRAVARGGLKDDESGAK